MEITPIWFRFSEVSTSELIKYKNIINGQLRFRMEVSEAATYDESDYELWCEECVEDDMPEDVARGVWNIAHSKELDSLRKRWNGI